MVLSIIVPVYNKAAFLVERCISSIIRQELPQNSEIILVDDGSSEGLSTAYEDICKTKGARYVYQKNKGVSAARNHGLDLAEGRFVMFVDADDALEKVDFCRWIDYMGENGVEVVSGCICKKYESDSIAKFTVQKDGEFFIYDDMSAIVQQILARQNLTYPELKNVELGGPCCKLYSISAIDSIRFDEDLKIGEDIFFNLLVYKRIKSICIVNDIWYTYYILNNSTMQSFSEELIGRYNSLLDKISASGELNNEKEKNAFYSRGIFHFSKVMTLYVQHGCKRIEEISKTERDAVRL